MTEGFWQGQPDLMRSGRFFSFALVLLILIGWIPLVFVPGTGGGWRQLGNIYAFWGKGAVESGRQLLLSFSAFRL